MTPMVMTPTDAGRMLFARAQAGERITPKYLVLGDGQISNDGQLAGMTQLISEKARIPITRTKRRDGYVSVSGQLLPSMVTAAFRWRELGVIMADSNDVECLYCVSNVYEQGDMLQPGNDALERWITADLFVGAATNVDLTVEATDFPSLIGPASRLSEVKPCRVLFITRGGRGVITQIN